MKRNHLNNKGSTMVLLLIAIAVLTILGTSLMVATMSGYKIKKANTQIKQSLYMSDAGLEKAYSNMYILLSTAANTANQSAAQFISGFNAERLSQITADKIAGITNIYGDYVKIQNGTGESTEAKYVYDDAKIQAEAKKLFQAKYKTEVESGTSKAITGGNDKNLVVSIDDADKSNTVKFTNDKMTLKITSVYTKDNGVQKTTAVELIVGVPEYSEPYTVVTQAIPINPYWTKVIACNDLKLGYMEDIGGGNIVPSQLGTISFTGDVFVNNDVNVDGNFKSVYPLNFNNKLTVRNDIKVNSDGNSIFVKDIFANNILLDGVGIDFKAKCSPKETVGSGVYVKDDLEMNKNNQKVNIEGSYYGLSDGSSNAGHNQSSSIIINSPDISATAGSNSSSLDISGDVHIYGSSYVQGQLNQAKNEYQTGESTSLRGNYKAYREPLTISTITEKGYTKDLTANNIQFTDYGVLSFADKIKNGATYKDLNVFDKAYYMYFYDKEYGNQDGYKLNKGGNNINLAKNQGSKLYTIGNTMNLGNLKLPTFNIGDIGKFNQYIEAYSLQSNALGDETVKSSGSGFEKYDKLEFSTDVKFDKIKADTNKTILKDGFTDIVYLNKSGGTYTLGEGKYKGLMVTKGDINITGNVDFTGAIICGGTIHISPAPEWNSKLVKKFTYDRNIVAQKILEYKLYLDVFKDDTSQKKMGVTYYEGSTSGKPVNVDFSKILTFQNWQIKEVK